MLSKPTSHLGSTLPSGEHGHAVLELVMNEGRNHAYSLQYTPLLWQRISHVATGIVANLYFAFAAQRPG